MLPIPRLTNYQAELPDEQGGKEVGGVGGLSASRSVHQEGHIATLQKIGGQ